MSNETAMEKIRAEHAIASRQEHEDDAILANTTRRTLVLMCINIALDFEKAEALEFVREYGNNFDLDTLKRGAGL